MAGATRRWLFSGAALAALGVGGWAAHRLSADAAHAAAAQAWTLPPAAGQDRAARLRALVHCATLAANGHNTQPWLFRLEAEGIRILPDTRRSTPVVDPDDHHLFASLGCAAENIAAAAPHYGFAAEVQPSPDGVMVALATTAEREAPLLPAIARRSCVRLDYDGAPLPREDWTALERAASLPGVEAVVHAEAGERERIAELVVAGNTAQMSDPAFVAELKHWIRFDGAQAARTLDGLYSASSGNPVVPPWLGTRLFDLAFTVDAENARYRRHLASSAGVMTLVAAEDAPAHWIQAGRAAQRMALVAAARDIRYAFLNQPVEVPGVRPAFMAFLGTDRRPNLVMRLGRGPLPPRSLRRPVEAVLVA